MSLDKVNPNAGRTNTVTLYLGAHDCSVTFSLVVVRGKLLVTILDAVNSATGKDTGLSDERLIEAVREEIKSKNILAFNYTEE